MESRSSKAIKQNDLELPSHFPDVLTPGVAASDNAAISVVAQTVKTSLQPGKTYKATDVESTEDSAAEIKSVSETAKGKQDYCVRGVKYGAAYLGGVVFGVVVQAVEYAIDSNYCHSQSLACNSGLDTAFTFVCSGVTNAFAQRYYSDLTLMPQLMGHLGVSALSAYVWHDAMGEEAHYKEMIFATAAVQAVATPLVQHVVDKVVEKVGPAFVSGCKSVLFKAASLCKRDRVEMDAAPAMPYSPLTSH